MPYTIKNLANDAVTLLAFILVISSIIYEITLLAVIPSVWIGYKIYKFIGYYEFYQQESRKE